MNFILNDLFLDVYIFVIDKNMSVVLVNFIDDYWYKVKLFKSIIFLVYEFIVYLVKWLEFWKIYWYLNIDE